MKLAGLFFACLLMGGIANDPCHAQPGFGKATKINKGWAFALDVANTVLGGPPAGAHWQQVDLPHDWSVRQPLSPGNASCMGYLPGGIGWYKKEMYVPAQGQRVYLYFEGVYNRSEVYVNGHAVGSRPNGYISFLYDVTPYIRFQQRNEVLVAVNHSRAADSRWYTGSGIYRDVWLVYARPLHISQWGVYAYPQLEGSNGILHIEVNIENKTAKPAQLSVVNELMDERGRIVAKDIKPLRVPENGIQQLKTRVKIARPRLWRLTDPVQYRLRTTVLQNGKRVDETLTKTGFRAFTFEPDKGFALNGEWMKIKGVCLHHDAGVLGAAMYRDVWRRRLLQLKEIGCNAIRTSHNPQAPALYDLCDELGLLVLNEAFDEWEYPKRKWLEGWNVGQPGFQGTYDFFEQWGARDLADMVQRDRNHPSVFAWSIGNEVDYPNDPYSHPVLDGTAENGFTQKIFGGYKKDAPDAMRLGLIAKKLAAVVRRYDHSRPVTAGLAGVAMSNETAYPSALDIAGYNYTESRYETDHKKYPGRVIFGSENRHDLAAWKAVVNHRYIFGQFLWTGIDYLGESGRWPSRGFYSGLLDFAGFIKPRGFYRQSLWSKKPMIYLGTGPAPEQEGERAPSMDAWPSWNYEAGRRVRVVCYTNAEKARLLLNGKPAGAIKDHDPHTGIIYWDIPYQPGRLKVEGLDKNGVVTATGEIVTAGPPYALQMLSGTQQQEGAEVAQLAVRIVDEKGNPVHTANNEITCTVTGPARLLGLEAGNNRDMGDYTDNRQHAFRGRLMAYIKRERAGAVKITFTAPSLTPVTVVL